MKTQDDIDAFNKRNKVQDDIDFIESHPLISRVEVIGEVETVVEKLVQVDKIKIVEVPKVVYEVQIKEVPVTKTRIVYLPGRPDTQVAPEVNPEELECMTLNIYREANNQSMAGQIAVARVVINRVQDRRYPGSPCDVIYDGPMKESWKTKNDPDLPKNERVFYPVRNKCQFSWYCDGKSDWPKDMDAWVEAQQIAYNMIVYSDARGITEGATHYHATYVSPEWARDFAIIGRIGEHGVKL